MAQLIIYYSQPDYLTYIIVNDLYRENNKECVLTVMKEPVPYFSPIVFNLAKNGPYTQAINEK